MLTNFYSTDWGKKSWTFFLSKAVVLKNVASEKNKLNYILNITLF